MDSPSASHCGRPPPQCEQYARLLAPTLQRRAEYLAAGGITAEDRARARKETLEGDGAYVTIRGGQVRDVRGRGIIMSHIAVEAVIERAWTFVGQVRGLGDRGTSERGGGPGWAKLRGWCAPYVTIPPGGVERVRASVGVTGAGNRCEMCEYLCASATECKLALRAVLSPTVCADDA